MTNNTLEALFEAQNELQEDSFDLHPLLMEGEERMEFLRSQTLALIAELVEMLDNTGWKPWASSTHVDSYPAIGEMIDAFHFFMNICLVVAPRHNPSPVPARQVARDLVFRYYLKHDVNAERQAQGYDGVSSKCENCNRELTEIPPILLNAGFCQCGWIIPKETVENLSRSNAD